MDSSWEIDQALQAISDFRRDLMGTPVSKLDLLDQERRVQQVINGLGRALMSEVLAHADVRQPEVTIRGRRWGNRRESEAPYTTLASRKAKSGARICRGCARKRSRPS